MTYRFGFSAFQSFVSILPKPLYLFLMLCFVGIKVFDKVCLVSPFLVLPCKFAQQHILLLDGMQLGIVMGDDAGQADGNQPNGKLDGSERPSDILRREELPYRGG